MTCEEMESIALSYIDDSLDPSDRDRVNLHLEGCASCRSDVEAARSLWAALAEPVAEGPSVSSRQRLRTDALSAVGRERSWRVYVPLAAAAVILLALSVQLLRRATGPSRSADPTSSLVVDAGSPVDVRLSEILACEAAGSIDTRCRRLVSGAVQDLNANIRIAAIDILQTSGQLSESMDAIAQSMRRELSPVVQAVIVDAVATLSDARAREFLREVAAAPRYHETVREQASAALNRGAT